MTQSEVIQTDLTSAVAAAAMSIASTVAAVKASGLVAHRTDFFNRLSDSKWWAVNLKFLMSFVSGYYSFKKLVPVDVFLKDRVAVY